MPRSATKSQADKKGRKSSAQVATPQPQDADDEDTISGRFTRSQWVDMLSQEESDEIVGEITMELMAQVMKGTLNAYIEKQLASYTASWAKGYLMEMLEQQFLCLDVGEGPEEASETEDSEPVPTASDPWLQGCVPIIIDPQYHVNAEQDISLTPEEEESLENQLCETVLPTSITPEEPVQETMPQKLISTKQDAISRPHFSPRLDKKKTQQTSLLPRPVPSKLLPPLSYSAVKKDQRFESKIRTLPDSAVSLHPPSERTVLPTVSLHPLKDRTALPKLGPSQLPQHCIKPQYDIFSNDITKPNASRQSGMCKLDHIRYKKQQLNRTMTSVGPITSSNKQEVRRITG